MNTKRLYKSTSNKKVAGVCGGLGNYFEVDPTILRVAFLAAFLMWGAGPLLYIILWLALDDEPAGFNTQDTINEVKDFTSDDLK